MLGNRLLYLGEMLLRGFKDPVVTMNSEDKKIFYSDLNAFEAQVSRMVKVKKIPRHAGHFQHLLIVNGQEVTDKDLFRIEFYKFVGIPKASCYMA